MGGCGLLGSSSSGSVETVVEMCVWRDCGRHCFGRCGGRSPMGWPVCDWAGIAMARLPVYQLLRIHRV